MKRAMTDISKMALLTHLWTFWKVASVENSRFKATPLATAVKYSATAVLQTLRGLLKMCR